MGQDPPDQQPTRQPSTKARVASDADHRKVSDEMTAAFHKNVAKGRADREELRKARSKT